MKPKMDWMLLPVLLLALMAATASRLDTRAATYTSNRRVLPQQAVQNNTDSKQSRPSYLRRPQESYGLRLPSKLDISLNTPTSRPNEESLQRPTSDEVDTMLMAGAGRRTKNKTNRDDDDDDEDKKTLSQQIADGKYGLIEKEIYATTPKRPGVISYATNPEVPRDTAKNFGGLEPEEIWLAENHVLVLRGGFFPEHKFNRTDDSVTAWPPIDAFKAPPRQVKIPPNPKVPPPFPVQLTDDGPTQFIGFNGSAGPPPFPPFFPQPPPGNGSYFAPPFPFPPPPGNFTPGGGFYPPPGNGSFFPPRLPFPLPPPRNGSFFVPPPGNFTPGSGPFFPPPFPGYPRPLLNGTFRPPFPPPPLLPNGSLPFPHHLLQNLPPGAVFLPPPGNLTEPFDEDDPSLYYPPPYDFYYPQDNSTEVPPGPLVPGIILPPPPNFFAPLKNKSDEHSSQQIKPPKEKPSTPHRTYLPGSRQKERRPPSSSYLPVTTDVRKKKPRPTINIEDNHVTPEPDIYVLTTPAPEQVKPPRPPNNVMAKDVQVSHQGSSRDEPPPPQGYYYEKPANAAPLPETVYINDGYSKINNQVVTTAIPGIAFYTAPVTDIVVKPTPKPANLSEQVKTTEPPPNAFYEYELVKEPKQPQRTREKVNIPTTTLAPLFIFYSRQPQQDIDTNRVTPQPYFVKAQGVTATLPPVLYYTVPSTGKPKEPTSIKTSLYFYEEPKDVSEPVKKDDVSTTTQTPEKLPSIPPSVRGKARKLRPQYKQSTKEELQSEVPPTQQPVKTVTTTKVSAQPPQYIYADAVPVEQVKTRPRTQQQYFLSSLLSRGQQIVFQNRGKLPYVSTPAPPQIYYVTASPGLQYNVLGSSTPAAQNQKYPSQQQYVKSTQQPSPLISNLAYFTTPRPSIYQNIVSSPRPILYNVNPSPRPIYQYSFESNKNPVTQEPNIYTTPRPKVRPPQKLNYPSANQGEVVYPVQYTTPRTLFEFSYQQQGLSTPAPNLRGFYASVGPQYDEPEDVTAGSPTTHYGYDDNREQRYQSTPRPNYNAYQNTPAPVNIYPTANPLLAYFTQQDEALLDDITKKYFTVFGQKLQPGEENGPTTPIPPRQSASKEHSKSSYSGSRDRQYYTTPASNYNYHTAERPAEQANINGGQISLADDINVNYKKPLPPINPLSEFVDTRQIPNSDTGGALVSYKFPGDGGHFYFITPQVVGSQSQQPANPYIQYSLVGQPQLEARYRRKKRKEQR